jgi:hypothetical protein
MSSVAIVAREGGTLLWGERARGLFNGFGYAMTLSALLMLAWSATIFLDESFSGAA